jgi:hypothetical protein
MSVARSGYSKIGWVILLVSAGLGLFFATLLAVAPNSILPGHGFRVGDAPLAIRIWGVTWIAFSLLALVLLLIPYRRGERWAWASLWLLPLLWLSHFALKPDTFHNLAIAVVTAVGLGLAFRAFFPKST